MPHSRFDLRKEYGLGVTPEIYSEEASMTEDDPKALLDRVSVAALVALLRQFGDLSKYAAEVFHGLQEQMSTTASRSRNLMTRMKHVEAVLPPLEKAMLSQTSHLQFAYTPGFEWHACIGDERNHFLYTDLPPCLMDSYEECREPPRLQLLDKFDPGGPGSCLKRYSDPTFVRKISRNSHVVDNEKSNKERKACEIKKRRSRKRSSCQYDASNFNFTDKQQSYSPRQLHQSSPTQTASTYDNAFKFHLEDQSDSLGSGDGIGLNECIPRPSASKNLGGGLKTVLSHDNYRSSILEKNGRNSSTFTWDGNVEIVEPMVQNHGMQELPSCNATSSEFDRQEIEPTMWKIESDEVQEVHETKFHFVEADIEPVRWNSRSYQTPQVSETNFEVDSLDIKPMAQISGRKRTPERHDMNFEFDVRSVEPHLGQNSWGNRNPEVPETTLQDNDQVKDPGIEESPNVTCTSFEGVDPPSLIFDMNQPDGTESDTENFVDALNTIESDRENDLDCQAKRDAKLCSYPKDDLEDGVHNEQTADTSYNGSGKGKFSSLRCSTSSLLLSCEDSLQDTSASCDISGDAPRQSIQSSFESAKSSAHPSEDAPRQSKQSSFVQDDASGIGFSVRVDIVDGFRQNSSIREFSSSEFEGTGLINGIDEGFFPAPYVSEQTSVQYSNVSSTTCWMKGGVLGPQPSKPPDFGTFDGLISNNNTTVDPWYQHLGPKDDNLQGNLDSLASYSSCDSGNTNFKQPTLVSDNHEIGSYKKLGLDKNLNNSVVSAHSRTQRVPTVIRPEAKVQCAADVRSSLDGASSFLSGFPHRARIYGFRSTRSMEYNEKPKALSCTKIRDHENGPHVTLHCSFSRISLTEEPPSRMTSDPASPPLENMKISFQPSNSFETSKLKLQQPEGTDPHSETLDAFSLFQLVPEPDLQSRFYSDIDDDTFCRSNHCISDDGISHHSGPNSELWGSPDSSESRDNIPCNTFCRTSSGGSISSFAEHEHTTNRSMRYGYGSSRAQNMVDLSHTSSSPPYIPLLQAMNPFVFQEAKIHSYPNDPVEPFDLRALTPELPPLPPLQWRVTKPQSGKQGNFDNHGSMFPHPTKPALAVQIDNGTEPMNAAVTNKQIDEQKVKVNVQEKNCHAANQRRVDEREDFLHQIRTKSFNLRKTGLLNPSPTPVSPVANVQVTAILEKAKTIRQVIASNDGEDDDCWSDT